MFCYKDISESQRKRILSEFERMSCKTERCDAESDKIAKAWLESKQESLGSFVGGKWIESEEKHSVINPCTGEELAEVSLASTEATKEALLCAQNAYPTWSDLSGYERGRYLYSMAQGIERQREVFAMLESICTAKPIRRTRSLDVGFAIQSFYHFAGMAMLQRFPMQDMEPLGVVYIIAANKNNPLMMCWHISAALASGNTVILEIDVQDCLSALLLAEIAEIYRLPAGVFNVLPQHAPPKLQNSQLLEFSEIVKVFFSGTKEMCRKVQEWAGKAMIECEVYCGIHPAVIVLEGADLNSAAAGTLESFCFNDARCESAGCTVFVQDCIAEKFVKKLTERFEKLRAGNCLADIDLSAINRSALQDMSGYNVIEHIQEKEGAEVTKIKNYPSECVLVDQPSLVCGIQTSSRLMEEQIHGQFLTVLPFRTTKEAVLLFNHSVRGDVSIWSEYLQAALGVAHEVKSGTVWVNSENMYDAISFGGMINGAVRGTGKLGLFHFMKPIYKAEADIPKNADKSRPEVIFCSQSFDLFYGGSFKKPASGVYIPFVYDTLRHLLSHVPYGSATDVRNAVSSAVTGQAKWCKLTSSQRAQFLFRAAEKLEARKAEFISMLSETTTSKYTKECTEEVTSSIKMLFYWASYCDKLGGTVEDTQMHGKVLQTYEPLGVIGIVCVKNYPLLSFITLVSSVVALGNAAVVIPDVSNPIPPLMACQIFEAAAIPGGIINVISTNDICLSEDLARNFEVNALWTPFDFTALSESVCHALAITQKMDFRYRYNLDWNVLSEVRAQQYVYHATYSKTVWLPMGNVLGN